MARQRRANKRLLGSDEEQGGGYWTGKNGRGTNDDPERLSNKSETKEDSNVNIDDNTITSGKDVGQPASDAWKGKRGGMKDVPKSLGDEKEVIEDLDANIEESTYDWKGKGGVTKDDSERLSNETETNEELNATIDDSTLREDVVQPSDASDRNSSAQAPVIALDEDGNPTLYSCSAAAVSSQLWETTVRFDYQIYFQSGRPADLNDTVAKVEGGMIRHIAEASSLPTSVDGNCSSFEPKNATLRFVRRSFNTRESTIVGVGAGDPDQENEVYATCVDIDEDSTISGTDSIIDCVPISGTVDIQMIGKDEVGAKNFVKGSARNWMDSYGDYETVHGLIGLVFLGTRLDDPEIGKEYVDPILPSEIQVGPESLVDDGGLTYLGYALATSLCATLALSLFIGARKVTKRCSDSDQIKSSPAHDPDETPQL